MTIAILYICTGKYTVFWEGFYRSVEKFFISEATKHYFVFTDADSLYGQTENSHIHLVYQEKMGWPYDTLKRFHLFAGIKEKLAGFDYIFFFNANTEILQPITALEFIPANDEELVAVLHPGYFKRPLKDFTYESRQKASTAYIKKGSGKHYFAGGLNGGKAAAYLQLVVELRSNVQADLEQNIIAVWHDESHLNKYLLYKKPKILSPAYIYPEGWKLPFNAKILIRDKAKHGGHDFLRDVLHKKTLKKRFYGFLLWLSAARKRT